MATERPKAGQTEERTFDVSAEGKRIRGKIPYGVESRDLGGFTEVIEPTALRNAKLDDLVATVDHAGVPLARYPSTLELEDRSDGLHWSLRPPESRSDVREAIERGDLRGGSWRMVVGKDRWDGDVRHVEAIDELRDVSVVTTGAYPAEAAPVELRSRPEDNNKEAKMADEKNTPERSEEQRSEEKKTEDRAEVRSKEKRPEARVTNEPDPVLVVEDRVDNPAGRGLVEQFRSRGFPGQTASISWDEFRTASFAGSIDTLTPVRREGVPLGADGRYAYPAFASVAVDGATTAVQVLQQTVRTLPAGTAVVRAIDAVTAKPEVVTTTNVATIDLKQVAAVETDIPNVILEQGMIQSLVEVDLRLSVNEGLDSLVNTGIGTAGTLTAGTAGDVFLKVRKGITQLASSGYGGDTLIIDPAGAEAIDLFKSSGSEAIYQFGPGRFAPGRLFGLNVRVSKTAGTAVVDSGSFGKLYVSPINLARFEQDAGSTNQSTVRLEGHAAFGVERTPAAVRII